MSASVFDSFVFLDQASSRTSKLATTARSVIIYYD